MTTMIVNMEPALAERVADAAAKRGEDASRFIVNAVERALEPQQAVNGAGTAPAGDSRSTGEEPAAEAAAAGGEAETYGARLMATLAPFWAEQEASPERFQPGLTPENAGDSVEAYLAQRWADDIRDPRRDRP